MLVPEMRKISKRMPGAQPGIAQKSYENGIDSGLPFSVPHEATKPRGHAHFGNLFP